MPAKIHINKKMKITKLPLIAAVACVSLNSCIQDEPLNAECDILQVSFRVSNPKDLFYNVTDTLQNVPSTKNHIIFDVRQKSDVSAVAPFFRLTEGATITPKSGVAQDFSKGPVTYTVQSQDGEWKREYYLSFNKSGRLIDNELHFDFENYELSDMGNGAKYYVWHNTRQDGTLGNDWATGNTGFAITGWDKKPEEFPSSVLAEGYDKAAVKLTTSSTGLLGAMFKKPIAAGNLFLGEFDMNNAVAQPLQATKFGIPINQRPLTFSGVYRYTAGTQVTDMNNKVLTDVKDSAAIYAVFYRNHDDDGNAVTLDGTNIKTSNLIVAMADMGYVQPASDWTHFDLPFEFKQSVDFDLLSNNGYSLAIVFSSSKSGDQFIGAVGSTLCIDMVTVKCDKME